MLESGTSGSWVVQGDTHLGYIVAVYDAEPYAHMIPIHEAFAAIQDVLHDLHDFGPNSHINLPDATEPGTISFGETSFTSNTVIPESNQSSCSRQPNTSLGSIGNQFHRDIGIDILPISTYGRDVDSIESRSRRLHEHEREECHTLTEKRSWPRESVPSSNNVDITSLAHLPLFRVKKWVIFLSVLIAIMALLMMVTFFSTFRDQRKLRIGVTTSTTVILFSVVALLWAIERTLVETLIAMIVVLLYGLFVNAQIDGFLSGS